MLKLIKKHWKSLSNFGKLAYTYFFLLICSNIYGVYESLSIKNYSNAIDYFLYSLTLITSVIILASSRYYLDKANKILKEANKIYDNDDSEIRMEMYQKLLEKNEEGVQ